MEAQRAAPKPKSKASPLADHLTPLIYNEWYVAGWSDEISRSPFSRKILGIDIVLYRKLDGAPVALRNRCPHRSFPLARGKLDGDNLICGYHGLEFEPDGACVHIPSQELVPPAVRAQNFQIVERHPLVWIWMGAPEKADPAKIPDHEWLNSPAYTHVSGYLYVKSSYIRLHENVLDLTHFPFLHGEALGDLAYAKAPFEVLEIDDSVRITRRLEGATVNPSYGAVIGNLGHRVNRTSESWFKTPAFHIAHATIEDLDGGVNGRADFHFKIQHLFTPETATSTHYFWASARDVAINNDAISSLGRTRAEATFLEDVEALEWIEQLCEEEEGDFREISVSGDRAGLLMRRIISRRAAAQA